MGNKDVSAVCKCLEEIPAAAPDPGADLPEILRPMDSPDNGGAELIWDGFLQKKADTLVNSIHGKVTDSGCCPVSVSAPFYIHCHIVQKPFSAECF